MKNSEEYTKSAANVLIFGDFNFHERIWKHGSGYLKTENRTVPEGEQRKQASCLLKFAEEFFLDQLINPQPGPRIFLTFYSRITLT